MDWIWLFGAPAAVGSVLIGLWIYLRRTPSDAENTAVYERDPSMTYLSRLLGYEPAGLWGTFDLEAVHPEDQSRVKRIWADLLDRPLSVATFRYRVRDGTGSWRWVEATGANLRDEPTVRAVVVNRRDITSEIANQQLLEQQMAERTRALESLYRADEMLHRSLRLEDVLQALVEVTSEVFGVDKMLVLMRDESSDRLVVGAATGLDVPAGFTLALDEDFPGSVVQSGEPLAIANYYAHHASSGRMRSLLEAHAVGAVLSVPILTSPDVFAVVNLFYPTPREFDDHERRLLTALAQRAGLALENARLYAAARGRAALEERQKLARELHDSVSQALYAIALNTTAASELLPSDPGRAAGLMADVLQLTGAGLAEMRALIFELRPESLEIEGLVGALEKQAGVIQARHHLRVETVLDTEPDVSLAIKEVVYRVAQEALHNVAKHARASSVDIVLTANGEELVLSIRDDGRGFDPAAEYPGHLGLRSMRERAAAIGASLDCVSGPGRGTQTCLRVPLGLPPAVRAGTNQAGEPAPSS